MLLTAQVYAPVLTLVPRAHSRLDLPSATISGLEECRIGIAVAAEGQAVMAVAVLHQQVLGTEAERFMLRNSDPCSPRAVQQAWRA